MYTFKIKKSYQLHLSDKRKLETDVKELKLEIGHYEMLCNINSKYLVETTLLNLRLSEECNWYEFLILNICTFLFCVFFFK